jgi:hypothetical protein
MFDDQKLSISLRLFEGATLVMKAINANIRCGATLWIRYITGWWFQTMEFYDFPIYWECHHPNRWLKPASRFMDLHGGFLKWRYL